MLYLFTAALANSGLKFQKNMCQYLSKSTKIVTFSTIFQRFSCWGNPQDPHFYGEFFKLFSATTSQYFLTKSVSNKRKKSFLAYTDVSPLFWLHLFYHKFCLFVFESTLFSVTVHWANAKINGLISMYKIFFLSFKTGLIK